MVVSFFNFNLQGKLSSRNFNNTMFLINIFQAHHMSVRNSCRKFNFHQTMSFLSNFPSSIHSSVGNSHSKTEIIFISAF